MVSSQRSLEILIFHFSQHPLNVRGSPPARSSVARTASLRPRLPNIPRIFQGGSRPPQDQPSSLRPRPSNARTWGREEPSSGAPEVTALLASGALRRDSRLRIGGKMRMTRYVRRGRPAPALLRAVSVGWGGAWPRAAITRNSPGPRVR